MSEIPSDQPRHRLLVVDDDAASREEIAQVLTEEGYEVVAAESGAAAAQKLGSESFDLVLSDVHMPNGGGEYLLQVMRTHQISVPIIMMTGTNQLSPMVAKRMGASAFLWKPLEVGALVERIESEIAGAQSD